MMQQIWVPETGDTTVMELRETSIPVPANGEVLIKVEACGINFADIMARKGLYRDAPDLPVVPGLEVAGIVEAVGPGVEAFDPGDRVMAPTRFGGYSSHVCVGQSFVVARPEGMSAEEGASFLVTYLTAFQAMVVMGGLRRPEELGRELRVLVVNASGGVGTAAADLGKIFGAHLAGAASPGKHDFIRRKGYRDAIDYRVSGWEHEALEITEGRGYDLILDPVGGSNWARSMDLLAPTGRLVMFGISTVLSTSLKSNAMALLKTLASIPWLRYSPLTLINQNRGVLGVNLARMWSRFDEAGYWIQQMLQWYEDGLIHPTIDRIFPLAEAGEAHRYIEERRNKGKVLLIPEH